MRVYRGEVVGADGHVSEMKGGRSAKDTSRESRGGKALAARSEVRRAKKRRRKGGDVIEEMFSGLE